MSIRFGLMIHAVPMKCYFQGSGGRKAKPSYPLMPGAVAGKIPSLEERQNKMEDVDRIRTNLRETRTVSSALLKVLMP